MKKQTIKAAQATGKAARATVVFIRRNSEGGKRKVRLAVDWIADTPFEVVGVGKLEQLSDTEELAVRNAAPLQHG